MTRRRSAPRQAERNAAAAAARKLRRFVISGARPGARGAHPDIFSCRRQSDSPRARPQFSATASPPPAPAMLPPPPPAPFPTRIASPAHACGSSGGSARRCSSAAAATSVQRVFRGYLLRCSCTATGTPRRPSERRAPAQNKLEGGGLYLASGGLFLHGCSSGARFDRHVGAARVPPSGGRTRAGGSSALEAAFAHEASPPSRTRATSRRGRPLRRAARPVLRLCSRVAKNNTSPSPKKASPLPKMKENNAPRFTPPPPPPVIVGDHQQFEEEQDFFSSSEEKLMVVTMRTMT